MVAHVNNARQCDTIIHMSTLDDLPAELVLLAHEHIHSGNLGEPESIDTYNALVTACDKHGLDASDVLARVFGDVELR
jgi:antirestriction protein